MNKFIRIQPVDVYGRKLDYLPQAINMTHVRYVAGDDQQTYIYLAGEESCVTVNESLDSFCMRAELPLT